MKRLFLILLLLPSLAFGRDLSKYFDNHLKTKYFIFHYDNDIKNIKPFSRFCDGFIDVVNRDFFKANFAYPIQVYVLKDQDALDKFLSEKAAINEHGLYGIYIPSLHGFVTRQDAGFGTFSHEIMHPLIHANFPRMPKWAEEGVPCFFEKFFGYYDRDSLILEFGFQNPWRIMELDGKITSLDLASIISSRRRFSESEERMVSVFLYQQGKFKTFLDLVKTNQKKGYKAFVEAAFEQNVSEITPLWQQYLKQVQHDVLKIRRIPASAVFASKEQFEQFMLSAGLH